jgi:hypothetical protein
MKKLLLLLLLAFPALAESPKREVFPSDYTPSPCAADTAAVCKSFEKERIADHGGNFRGFNISQEWVNAHWDELMQAFTPLCAKIANCFTVKGNNWVFCVDLIGKEFRTSCDRYPADSEDRRQCGMVATIYVMGMGAKGPLHKAAQACTAAQPVTGLRKLEAWLEPSTFTPDYDGPLIGYAYDAETKIPVRASFTIDGGKLDMNRGSVASVGYPTEWRAGFNAVPNAQGHRDFVPPTVTFTAEGYEPLTIPIAIEVPALTVIMIPPPEALKAGTNTISVEAYDAVTNKPVEMRVMAGDRVLGKSNTPLQFEWKKGEKRPEIWLTSLWNRYSDVVIAPAE